jgi:hypothetical protein
MDFNTGTLAACGAFAGSGAHPALACCPAQRRVVRAEIPGKPAPHWARGTAIVPTTETVTRRPALAGKAAAKLRTHLA